MMSATLVLCVNFQGMPGSPGEKGESGHVGSLVSIIHQSQHKYSFEVQHNDPVSFCVPNTALH